MLTDTYGRRFYYLRLSITDVCNFRCNYCLPDGYQCDHDRSFLTLDEIKRVAAGFAALGTQKIRITGGEPSLRKDLPQIIEACKNTQGIKQVAITSNGYKLSSQISDWLDAGLDALNLSIDSLDPRQFKAITGHDKLDEILTGIEKAHQLGFTNIKINSVLLKGFNGNALQSFLDFIKSSPITIRFIELMQTGDNATFFGEQHVKGEDIKRQLLATGWLPLVRNKTSGPAEEFYHPNYAGKIGLIMPYSKDFCASCNRLRISALGKLHLCLFAEQGLSIREHLTTDDPTHLQHAIVSLLNDKKASHFLQDKMTGATRNLAMLGG